MAYEYDGDEREDSGGAFLMGLLAGTVLGAGLGMLFAPKPGAELRNQLSDSANRLQKAATDGYQQASEKVSHMVDRSREAYDRARGTVTQQAANLAETGRETYERARDAVARGTEEIRGQATEPRTGESTFDQGVSNVRPPRRNT